jgi:hypothetical protein
MLRTDGDAEQRVFDPTTRLLHWLTVDLITLVFVLAFSIDLATSRASRTQCFCSYTGRSASPSGR